MEALKASTELDEGSATTKPPHLAGRAINFLSVLFSGGRPVSEGMSANLMASSNGWSLQCRPDGILQWLEFAAYVRGDPGEIRPFAEHAMGVSSEGSMGLGSGYFRE